MAQGLQSYKVENALHDQINKFDTCTQQESMGRECFRSNDFPRIPNLDDLLKNLKPDYPKDLDTEPSLDNFTVSSELNPDIVNLLDNLDDVIAKSFKFSEPEELFQTVPRKKTQKIRKVSKGQGRGKNKKGENGDDELEGSEKGESTLDNDGNQSISGTKVFSNFFNFHIR